MAQQASTPTVKSSSSSSSSSSTSLTSSALSLVSGITYKTSVYLARQACLSLFSRLDSGEASGLLEIREHSPASSTSYSSLVFGEPVAKRAWRQQSNLFPTVKGESSKHSEATHAILDVQSETFWIRLAVGNDLGFAEAFMGGEITTPDLASCFKLFIENRYVLSNFSVGLLSRVTSQFQALLNRRYANTKQGSLRNIGAHYDISNTMYEAFLSADMTYSCAVFPTLDADVTGPLLVAANAAKVETEIESVDGRLSAYQCGTAPSLYHRNAYSTMPSSRVDGGATTTNGQLTPDSSGDSHGGFRSPCALSHDELEDGQLRKLRIVIERASLRKCHQVLEVGTGWGSLAIEAVRSSGCEVDSLTLSVEQKALAEGRIAAAGLSDKIRIHLMDYRDMPLAWTDRFDRVISIEMLEAVGIEFLSTYFASVDRALKKDGGVLVLQCITMPEERFQTYIETVDFIKRWIFPGGVLPSVTSIVEAVEKGGKKGLVLDTTHSIGPHYSRTLREWRKRFEANYERVIKPALLRDHDEICRLDVEAQEKECEVFRRKWIYYFVYCEVGFTERVIGDHIFSFSRTGNTALPVCCG